MKVLWITNILFPEAVSLISHNSELKSSGGWMLAAAQSLLTNKEVCLSVATVSPLVKELTKVKGKDIIYYIIPIGRGNINENNEYIPYWKSIRDQFQPDVVHIHGTEYSHGYAYVVACGAHNVVVSVQGLKSACAKYYCEGMSNVDILMNLTLRDILRGTIWASKKSFQNSAAIEDKFLKRVDHIIGRTSWDKTKIWAINPSARYHFCNETLRAEFYSEEQWSYDSCKKHSIFLSQASYPIKGLHQLLKALPIILRQYPDTIVRVAGPDITNKRGLSRILHYTGYGKYIRNLIHKLNLEQHVHFIGSCNAEEMKNEYLRSNIFVCPSSIENSPNSLAEAQILGVPCVASYVGGIPDMMVGNETNLYRYEEVEMLAYNICNVFANKCSQFSSREIARKRHDTEINRDTLLEIYREVIG